MMHGTMNIKKKRKKNLSGVYHYVDISEDVQIEPVRGIIRGEGLEAVQNSSQTR
jgi:hypothetical protein